MASQLSQTELGHALVKAAKRRDWQRVNRLISQRASVNATNEFGTTALHYACIHSHMPTCSLMIENGANVNATNRNGHTPLHSSIISNVNSQVCSSLLLENGADVHATDYLGQTALHKACTDDRLQSCNVLIDYGANLNAIDNRSGTPLHSACIFHQARVCDLFLERGASPEARDRDGNTQLHLLLSTSVSHSVPAPATMLIERGSNVNVTNQ